MNGQILKKYQQKELNLMRVTCKKTRNYIFFFAVWETARKLNKQKQVKTDSAQSSSNKCKNYLLEIYL